MSEIKNPSKAIREYCKKVCCCNSSVDVRECKGDISYTSVDACPLYPFRFGKNPFNKRNLTEEQRKALAERLANNRDKRQ